MGATLVVQASQNCHHRRVGQIDVELLAHFGRGQRFIGAPQDLHDIPLEGSIRPTTHNTSLTINMLCDRRSGAVRTHRPRTPVSMPRRCTLRVTRIGGVGSLRGGQTASRAFASELLAYVELMSSGSRNTTRLGATSAAVLVALLLTGCADNAASPGSSPTASEASNGPSQLLEPAAFAAFIDSHPDAPVVNVHIPYEGHIEGTDDFVPFEDITEWSGLPDELDAPIILYCRSGNMSAQATDDLAELGYTNVVDLAGGMNEWTDAGLALLDDPTAATTP